MRRRVPGSSQSFPENVLLRLDRCPDLRPSRSPYAPPTGTSCPCPRGASALCSPVGAVPAPSCNIFLRPVRVLRRGALALPCFPGGRGHRASGSALGRVPSPSKPAAVRRPRASPASRRSCNSSCDSGLSNPVARRWRSRVTDSVRHSRLFGERSADEGPDQERHALQQDHEENPCSDQGSDHGQSHQRPEQ